MFKGIKVYLMKLRLGDMTSELKEHRKSALYHADEGMRKVEKALRVKEEIKMLRKRIASLLYGRKLKTGWHGEVKPD